MRIRLEGTSEDLQEAYSRLQYIFSDINWAKQKDYDKPNTDNTKYRYLRCYYYDRNSLLDQLFAAQATIRDLEILVGMLELEILDLKSKPRPLPTDVVLGSTKIPREFE